MLNKKQATNIEPISNFFPTFRNFNSPELQIQKISTGYPSLDEILGGGLATGVHTICAQPGVGKTTFALNIAVNAAKNGTPVIFLSYEMPKMDLITKIYSLISSQLSPNNGGFSFDDIRSEHKLTTSENKLYKKTCDFIESNFNDKIYFLDGVNHQYKINQIVNEIEAFMQNSQQAPLVIVDYIQMIAGEDSVSLKTNIETAMSVFHNIADKYHFPILSISSIAKHGSDSLNMFSGAESARIAFGSVTHWGLTNMTKDDDALYKTVKLDLFKNRYGKSNTSFNFSFDGEHSRFLK